MTTLASVDSVLMIADIARTLNDFRPLGETLDHICQRVGGVGGYDFSAVLLPADDRESLRISGSWGMSPTYVEHINTDHPIRLEPTSELGLSPTAEAFRSGRPVALPDVEQAAGFRPWRRGARLERYRSLVCVPVILRSQVIGVINCYGRATREHAGPEIELLQLVARLAGVAIETARVAESQRRAVAELRALSDRLREQNRELSRLSAVQARLTEQLSQPDATAVERTARTLAEISDRSVLIAGPAGNAITYAGLPGPREAMAALAARRDVGSRLRQLRLVGIDGHTCLRVGPPEMPLGMIVLHPALEDERGVGGLVAVQAAAVVAAELQGERADRALETHARPAVMLAMAHGLYGRAQLREVSGVLGVPAESELRLAAVNCPTPESAHRLSRRIDSLRGAGWPLITASASGRDALVLLAGGPPEGLRRAAGRLRERHPEVVRIGISGLVAGPAELPAARRQALSAVAVDPLESAGATLFEDLGAFGELAEALPAGRADQMIERTLGVLIDHDRERGTRLLETLAAHVRYSGQAKEAARALRIHPNTFHQRLRRITELSGFDLRDYSTLSSVVLALEWRRIRAAREEMEEKS